MPDIDEGYYVDVRTSRFNPSPYAPYDLVESRFTRSLSIAEKMIDLLVGTSGDRGYLGILNDYLGLQSHTYDFTVGDVNTNLTVSDIGDAPQFNDALIKSFPDFSVSDPSLEDMPKIDIADLQMPTEPDEINPQIVWSEMILNSPLYQKLVDRLETDIVDGATGLAEDVQDAIFALGRERQRRAREIAYRKLNNDISARGALVPSGALLGALAEFNAEALEKDTEVNNTITVEQAQLAQRNTQFVIDQTRQLEALLRDDKHKDSDRALDYAKAVAQLTLQVYSEKVRMYIAVMESKKIYIEAQVANLQGVVAYNTALIEQYKAILSMHQTKVEAISSENRSHVEVYNGKVSGYAAEASATASLDQVRLDKIKVELAEQELVLREQIAEAEANIKSWGTEYELKQAVAKAMGDIANQALIGALNSVHANASMGYTGSESRAEQWSQSKSLNENHSYQEDPEVT